MTAPLALVTGGQQGIGLGIVKALTTNGFRVAVASLPSAEEALDVLEAFGADVHYFQHDLADLAGIPALLKRIEATQGPVDALIQNAGVAAKVRGDVLDLTPENLDWILRINLSGGFFLAQEVARRMLASPGPHYRSITFITSVSAGMASPDRADYCISKAAASMAAQALALRLAPHGIGVFELRPGIIETAMTGPVKEKYDTRIADGLVPMGRWGQPADIGQAVIPLVSGQMAFATGAVIPVDGGLSIERL